MTAGISPWWKGLRSDHIYEDCPALRRSEPELKRHSSYGMGRGELYPEDGDVCGWCLRAWRARNKRTA